VRAAFTAVVLLLAIAAPARAQTAQARMTASASVVAPVSVNAAAVAVSQSAAGVDVTRPLDVGGPVAWVLEVVEGASYDRAARRLTAAPRARRAAADAGQNAAGNPVTIRLSARPADAGPRPVTYVVAMVN
jgi:hypothetical protein